MKQEKTPVSNKQISEKADLWADYANRNGRSSIKTSDLRIIAKTNFKLDAVEKSNKREIFRFILQKNPDIDYNVVTGKPLPSNLAPSQKLSTKILTNIVPGKKTPRKEGSKKSTSSSSSLALFRTPKKHSMFGNN